MKFKAVTLVSLSVIALAVAATTVVGARGAGEVTNAAGKKGRFSLEVSKGTNGTNVRFAGGGGFATRIEENGRVGELSVRLIEMKGGGKQGPNFVAEGRGVLRISFGPNNVREFPGGVRIAVSDLKTPTSAPTAKDKFGIRFNPAPGTNGRPFEFGGNVTAGDLVVFERQLP
jgi:hypothetical protein